MSNAPTNLFTEAEEVQLNAARLSQLLESSERYRTSAQSSVIRLEAELKVRDEQIKLLVQRLQVLSALVTRLSTPSAGETEEPTL